MSCNQPLKTKVSIPVVPNGSTPTHLVGSKSNTSTRFVISDNPETISPSIPFENGFATLWHDTTTGESSIRYRVFLWHLNKRGTPIKVGITVGNAGTTSYSIHNLKSSVAVVNNFVEQGRCTATALVADTLDSISATDSSVSAGNVGVVKEWIVPADSLVGGVIEFSLSNTATSTGMVYKLRTVAASSSTANLRQNQNKVTPYVTGPTGQVHPRGSWNFADIASSVNYAAGTGWKYFNMSNAQSDNLMTASTSYDPSNAAASNKGHYGAKYNLTVNLTNKTGFQKVIKIYIGARVDPYGGAVKWSGDGVTYTIPTLAGPGATTQEAVEVAKVTLEDGQSISRVIYSSAAGGLSTPALVAFQTI